MRNLLMILTNTQRPRTLSWLLATAITAALPCEAQDESEAPPVTPTAPVEAKPAQVIPDEGKVNAELIIVQGTPGEENYAEDFAASAKLWKEAGEKGLAKVTFIGPDNETQREKLKEVIASMQPDSPIPLWIVLIGHGTFDKRAANFNLTGEDVSALDLGEWLDEFKRPIILIHGGAASAPYVRRLSREGRVIITATKKGSEVNYTRFGTFMARALQSPEADLNNDGQASVYECFLYAARQTAAFYETNGLLATEHSLIDDNGDGRGSELDLLERYEVNSTKLIDGDYARLWSLVLNDDEMKLTPDQRRRRNVLERQILELRRKRGDYAEESAFYADAEPLLLEIARIYTEIEDVNSEPEPESQAEPQPEEPIEAPGTEAATTATEAPER
ncbi:MAG: hypothetical protein R3F19_22555 [Verrucomicrobiales bacterium]|nr:hypothetical protein [Verrucomicrobiae bacterium]